MLTGEYKDPLAQTFRVDEPEDSGIFVTSLDLYFQAKPAEGSTDEFRVLGTTDNDQTPVEISIREVRLGTPSQIELANSRVSLSPDDIEVSQDASVATKFTFESPVFLSGMKEYAFIIESNSTDYRVWISRLGEFDIGRDADDQVCY